MISNLEQICKIDEVPVQVEGSGNVHPWGYVQMRRPSLGITPRPTVGLCGETHLDKGCQEQHQ